MRVPKAENSDVTRYIDNNRCVTLEDKEADYSRVITQISMFKEVGPGSTLLEIGVGTGWFPLSCQRHGIACRGLEISPQLVEYSKEFGAKYGLVPDIHVGNIEETDIGEEAFDVIIALSVFEHVEDWQTGLRRIYRALKPGGVFVFGSTNKFAFTSGEYNYPFYGWMPNSWRYKLRVARQGPDIMELGIDFNQFTYFQLRSFFKSLGFSEIIDRVDIGHRTGLVKSNPLKKALLNCAHAVRPLRECALLFMNTTNFVCVK